MNELSRRTFIKGLGATIGLALVPMSISAPPKQYILWGDGHHDDAPAMQAIFDGKHEQVEVRSGSVQVVNGRVDFGPGTYLLGSTVDIGSNPHVHGSGNSIHDCHFIGPKEGPLFRINDGATNNIIQNIILDT